MSQPNGSTKKEKKKKQPRKLVLFFDGTGNKFCGNGADTNIVKLHNMCDQSTEKQFHYYQPGIGTYVPGSNGPINPGPIGRSLRKVSQSLDEGFATSFDDHVIAGYKFLMRYYKAGAYIYIFGFSRGAFTARFLASLITHVGLLSMGNEELIPFAYEQYLAAGKTTKPREGGEDEMTVFKKTFCRPEVVIKFLGLFDTVSSVALFDIGKGVGTLPSDLPIAKHIRHAVALDECRTKFKPALFGQKETKQQLGEQLTDSSSSKTDVNEVLKECWFVGNHGDVGGGWDPYYWYRSGDRHVQDEWEDVPVFKEVKGTNPPRFHPTGKTTKVSHGTIVPVYKPEYQMSDIALQWMLEEMDKCLLKKNDDGYNEQITFLPRKQEFLENMSKPEYMRQARTNFRHSCLTWDGGSSKVMVFFWWVLEVMPGLKHLELEHGKWVARYTPNLASKRDIPRGAMLHSSVKEIRPEDKGYTIEERMDQEGWIDALVKHKWLQQAPGSSAPKNRWWKKALYFLPLAVVFAVRPVLSLFSRGGGYSRLD